MVSAVRSALAIVGIALTVAAAARADDLDKVIVDRIDLEPSRLNGLARIRALVSATELRGARIPQDGAPNLTLKVGGSKAPFVLGVSAQAEVEVDAVLIISTTDTFAGSLDGIRDALDADLLGPIEKLGPTKLQVAVIGYGENTIGQKRLAALPQARAALRSLEVDDITTQVALIDAIRSGLAMVTRPRPKLAGAIQRPMLIVVSDGAGIDEYHRADITALGVEAGRKGVRIHALAYSPDSARRPLLTLGELAKQSGGTFRWVQSMEGWSTALTQLADQLTNQYVLTALTPLDGAAGRSLAVSIANAGDTLSAPSTRLPPPRCGRDSCEADAYCVRDQCVARRHQPGRTVWRVLLWGVGILAGLLVVGLGGRALLDRRARGPRLAGPPLAPAAGFAPAMPSPAAPVAPPVIAPGTPVLIVMSGPAAGQQVPLHHGLLVGKAADAHLSLAHDPTASGHHAQLTFDGQAWNLTDLDSTNGSFANGNRISTVRLFPGMTLRLGSTELRFWQA
ncbi:MAG: FHA domain-containing protein [Kofleriaceae bacterium]